MIARAMLAVIVAVAVGLLLLLLGSILDSLGAPVASTVGGFLLHWGYVIGVLAGLWYYFAGPA